LAKKAVIGFLSFLLFLSLATFGAAFVAKHTILNPDFIISELNRLDVSSLATDMLREQIPTEELPVETEVMVESIEEVVTDLEPWIREQVNNAVYAGYDYLLGESEGLSLVIDLGPVKEELRDTLWQALLESPPPELEGVPPAEIELYFSEFYQGFSEQIPTIVEIDESMIDPQIMGTLEQTRRYVHYLLIAYWVSIGAMIGIIVGLAFLHRNVKGATRSIGIPCLVCGVLALVGALVTKYLAMARMAQFPPPAQLQVWLPQFINNIWTPAQIYGIGLMVTGIALLIVSVVYKRRQPSI